MTDLTRHAERIKSADYSVEVFAKSLAGQMNIHDRNSEQQWINVAMITADYALYKYKKSPEIVKAAIFEQNAGLSSEQVVEGWLDEGKNKPGTKENQ